VADNDRQSSRRRFLAGGAAAAAGLVAASTRRLEAAERQLSGATDHDAWIERMAGEDRFLFDASDHRDGRLLGLIHHYYDTHRDSYGLSEREVSAAGTLYGTTIFFGLTDAMWAKYPLGAAIGDETLRHNPWRTAPVVRGKVVPTAGIESLQQRGAVFLLCYDGLKTRSRQVAAQVGREAPDVLADMEAHVLPGVVVVPSVIVAIQRAQRRGVAYYRVG
jgi:intracellular sulfur oxidation DsrE/DsrF family protein